jgi:hypothetical protein
MRLIWGIARGQATRPRVKSIRVAGGAGHGVGLVPVVGRPGRLVGDGAVAEFEGLPQQQAQGLGVVAVVVEQPLGIGAEVAAVRRDRRGEVGHEAFEDGGEEPVLVAEVVVDGPLVGLGVRGDAVDAGAGDTVLGELGGRRREDAFPGRG